MSSPLFTKIIYRNTTTWIKDLPWRDSKSFVDNFKRKAQANSRHLSSYQRQMKKLFRHIKTYLLQLFRHLKAITLLKPK